MKWIIFLALIFCVQLVQAQAKTVTVHSSQMDQRFLSDSATFRYPAFTRGFIYYKDGSRAHADFNWNLFADEMQFLHPAGDTLAITDEESIRLITVGKDSFLIKKGIVELLPGSNYVKLGRNQKIIVASRERVGAYGESSGTTSITSFGSFYANDQVFKLKVNENLLLEKLVSFYFIRNDFLIFLPASRNNIMKMARNKDEVQQYLKNNKVDFKNEADLKGLLQVVR